MKATSTSPVKKERRAPKTSQMERTRNAVLDAVIELLGEVTYGRLTIDIISERSGSSRSTIYRYWKTLPELVSDAFDRAVGPAPVIPLEGSLREQLITLFSQLPVNLEQSTWGRVLPSLIAASNSDSEFAGRIQKIANERRSGVRDWLRERIDAGELKPGTNVEWVIDALSSTFYQRHFITGAAPSEPGLVEWTVDMVLKSIQNNDYAPDTRS